MPGNSFGEAFRVTTFGESHGVALGGIIDGCPAGLEIDLEFVKSELQRRKPGQSHITTQRKEEDEVKFLSGIFEGKTTGHPIGFTIENTNQKSTDYEHIKDTFRPSHADYTYQEKYGIRDYRGGGRSSARETACRIAGGAIAKLYLKHLNVSMQAYVSQVGNIKLEKTYQEFEAQHKKMYPSHTTDQIKAAYKKYSEYFEMEEAYGESWVVYNKDTKAKIPKSFKNRKAAYDYAAKNGGVVYSAEYYFDNQDDINSGKLVKEESLDEAVQKIDVEELLDAAAKMRKEMPALRKGQSIMITLHNMNPKLYSMAVEKWPDTQ